MRTLILGGARSGKSTLAERLATDSGRDVAYVATAEPGDREMADRIAHHQQRRPADWVLVEEPIHLAAALRSAASAERFVLVDCLTLWLTNVLAGEEEQYLAERQGLLDVLPNLVGDVCLVGNEVGLGIVPMGAMTRRYVDEAGRLHQDIAAVCENVVFVAAGLPLALKGSV